MIRFLPILYHIKLCLVFNFSIFPCSLLCESGSLDPSKVKGKILLCLRGDNARVEKGFEALKAGAVGMILANNVSDANDRSSDPHVLPVSHINYTDGQLVFAYVNTSKYLSSFFTSCNHFLN